MLLSWACRRNITGSAPPLLDVLVGKHEKAWVGATLGLPLAQTERVVADWDEQLAAAMADRGLAVHEEAVAETLMADLEMARGRIYPS